VKKKLMLINAAHPEQARVAIVEDGFLQEMDIESADRIQTKNNIYKGTVTKVEASLQAAFVEYGANRQGFLSLGEIHPDYWKKDAEQSDLRKASIQDVLENRQSVLVQVVKEERGNKGAALTTYISLAGRYLVLSPNTTRVGISRKLSEEDRRAMKRLLSELNVPEDVGVIVRTAGKDQTLAALQRDFSYLQRLWDEIRIKAESAPAPSFIYLDGDLATRAIRDHFSADINEIWVDKHDIYQRTKQFVHAVLPGKEKLVKIYRGKKPIFRHYGIEEQCEEIHERQVRLPSGGAIVFDPTEALTAIDVNSGRSTSAKHIDDTALATNLEAAHEIARQLRIRDVGGLIVIDFIDMASRKHAQKVEEKLRDACKNDKARIQIARISRFGLLEMSRQRLGLSIRESTTQICPRCTGRGRVRTVETMALQMLTRMEDHAAAGKGPRIIVQVPADTGEYLMNNKRQYVARIEENYSLQINLQIRPDLEIPHYRIERQWPDNGQQRVEVLEDTLKGKKPARSGRRLKSSQPVVSIPSQASEKEGWGKKLIKRIFGSGENVEREAPGPADRKDEERARPRKRRSRGGRRRRPVNRPSSGPGAGQPQKNAMNQSGNTPAETAPPESGDNGATDKPPRRRRRRRRPRNNGGQPDARDAAAVRNISPDAGDE